MVFEQNETIRIKGLDCRDAILHKIFLKFANNVFRNVFRCRAGPTDYTKHYVYIVFLCGWSAPHPYEYNNDNRMNDTIEVPYCFGGRYMNWYGNKHDKLLVTIILCAAMTMCSEVARVDFFNNITVRSFFNFYFYVEQLKYLILNFSKIFFHNEIAFSFKAYAAYINLYEKRMSVATAQIPSHSY